MNSPHTTLYRDKHNARLMGVCAGVADYTGIGVFWVRLIAVLMIFAFSGIIIPAYLIAGLLLQKKPAHLYVAPEEQRYWQSVRQSPRRTARQISARMKDIDRRLAAVEGFYVDANPRLSAEIENLR